MSSTSNLFRYLGDQHAVDPAHPDAIAVLVRPLDRSVKLEEQGAPVQADVLNLAGEVLRSEAVPREEFADLLQAQRPYVGEGRGLEKGFGQALVSFLQADDGAMSNLVEALAGDARFEVSAWFERDRQRLTLSDKLTGKDVVDLIDEDVSQAIEDGFLTAPRRPRPQDSDWLQPLLDYAKDTGAMNAFSVEPAAKPAGRTLRP